MTTAIKGPSGPGGPTGPVGTDDLPDADRADQAGRAGQTAGAAGAERAGDVDPMIAVAADLDAGRISPDQALARLLDDGLGPDLDPAQRAELEGLFADLLATDPYLAGLARDLGAGPIGGGPGGANDDGGGPAR